MHSRHLIPMGLRAAYRLMHRQTGAWLAALGVTADQFVLLTLLEGEDGVTQQELVHRASSDPNTIRAMLVLLEKRGLVNRRAHPGDRRALLVTMTRKGRLTYTRLSRRIRPLQERLTEPFTEEETKIFLEFLERVEDALSK